MLLKCEVPLQVEAFAEQEFCNTAIKVISDIKFISIQGPCWHLAPPEVELEQCNTCKEVLPTVLKSLFLIVWRAPEPFGIPGSLKASILVLAPAWNEPKSQILLPLRCCTARFVSRQAPSPAGWAVSSPGNQGELKSTPKIKSPGKPFYCRGPNIFHEANWNSEVDPNTGEDSCRWNTWNLGYPISWHMSKKSALSDLAEV